MARRRKPQNTSTNPNASIAVRAGQVWMHKPRRGRRKFIRILRVKGKHRATIVIKYGPNVLTHREPAEANYIDVGRSNRPKHGMFTTPNGWTDRYHDKGWPGRVLLEWTGRGWAMPEYWNLCTERG